MQLLLRGLSAGPGRAGQGREPKNSAPRDGQGRPNLLCAPSRARSGVRALPSHSCLLATRPQQPRGSSPVPPQHEITISSNPLPQARGGHSSTHCLPALNPRPRPLARAYTYLLTASQHTCNPHWRCSVPQPGSCTPSLNFMISYKLNQGLFLAVGPTAYWSCMRRAPSAFAAA